ncbi:putative DUF1789 domain protein [Idiomarinaceae phage Phi1M2-2]|uniref:putative DUF1789 domain protein n=1 Tax=Idiomarinaceae phage Phi1M2-2 TaxID=1527515 RepID=UPI0004F5F685|nr:putative DUF1789 domain protein [Idiomarinaceae phage Phi1M2-2]AIM40782.1 putative DUF1789 domain protein [Idiomarinaceae phage Phi1M2-2]
MASIKELFTREQSEQAEKLYIGDEWVEIYGADAAHVRQARREIDRDTIAGKISVKDATAKYIKAVIKAWSFDEELTEANIKSLVEESPSFIDKIDQKAGERANFTRRLNAASSNTPEQSSGSEKSGKARKG